jgi:putative PIN family toxin of toxin-antitoxin system
MNDAEPDKAVFDCNVFLQSILNPDGPSGRCVDLARAGDVLLFTSDAIYIEIRDLANKPIGIERGLTVEFLEAFIIRLRTFATHVDSVPDIYTHPVDADDSCYVNLALAIGAKLIVSRDRHLLNLTNSAKPWSAEFRRRFPTFRVLQPHEYLTDLRAPYA